MTLQELAEQEAERVRWDVLFYGDPQRSTSVIAQAIITVAEAHAAEVASKLAAVTARNYAYETLLTAHSWGAAIGAVAEDYPDIVEQINGFTAEVNKELVEALGVATMCIRALQPEKGSILADVLNKAELALAKAGVK